MSQNMSRQINHPNRIPAMSRCAKCNHIATAHAKINSENTERGACGYGNCQKFVPITKALSDEFVLSTFDEPPVLEDGRNLSPENEELLWAERMKNVPTGLDKRPLFTAKHYSKVSETFAHEGRILVSSALGYAEFYNEGVNPERIEDVRLFVARINQWQVMVNLTAHMFRDDNSRFNWDMFKEFCEYGKVNSVYMELIKLVRAHDLKNNK